jgi:hypothetical protein
MDNKMYQDEFEQFLQDEVKQHRMYPSDSIWKNIRMELHGYKAWPALTFISLFIITALTVSTLLNNHPDRHVFPPIVSSTQHNEKVAVTNGTQLETPIADDHYFEKIAPGQITAQTFADMKEAAPEETVIVAQNSNSDNAPVLVKLTADRTVYTEKEVTNSIAGNSINTATAIDNTSVAQAGQNAGAESAALPTEAVAAEETTSPKKADTHTSADDFLKDFGFVGVSSVPRRNSKFGFQFYITPSNSYRRLSDEKVKDIIQPAVAASSPQNVPLSTNVTANVNDVVRHKPALGFEAGFAFLYNMSSRLKFKTGIQLNVREYYIETFQSLTNDLASLSLINYRGVETISFYSPYNNNTGYRKTQLDNKVYQLSVPVGLQWDMIQGKHLGISTEASVQPTFTLNNNTYLLSTDYTHYTTGNQFFRKWNINTSVGLNITYTSGASSWQIGPQIRYQHLPTYSNVYPIKEYLVDYGIRLGFTHQIK